MTPVLAAAQPSDSRDKVWVSEGLYQRCYRAAIGGTLAMCAVAIVLAYADGQPKPGATVAIASLLALAAFMARGDKGYEWLRQHPTALALTGPLAVVSAVWPSVDENALYFPVLGPLAIIACVASHRRQAFAVIASLAAGTFLAALLDYRDPAIASPDQLATATIGVLISGTMFITIADWCAVWVLEAVDTDPTAEAQTPLASASVQASAPPTALPEPKASAMAQWMLAIRSWIVIRATGSRQLWRQLTGFRGRELQILLLLGGGLTVQQIASFLLIKASWVKECISTAVARRNKEVADRLHRSQLTAADEPDWEHTPEDIAAELFTRYPDVSRLERLVEKYRDADSGKDP